MKAAMDGWERRRTGVAGAAAADVARRAQHDAAVRLAVGLSLVAVPVAAVASAVGAATSVLVLLVLVVGFGTSWVQSGRLARVHALSRRHGTRRRVSVVTVAPPLG
jgi:hypothetical protein